MVDSEFATFSIRMPEPLKERIELMAKRNYNSRNGMICLAVERLLDSIEVEKLRQDELVVINAEEVGA